MRPIVSTLTAALAFLLAFAGTAAAQSVAAGDEGSLLDLARPVLDALLDGKPGLAAMLALVVVAAGAQKWLAPRVPFFATSLGAALIVLVGSFGGAAAALLSGGATWSLALVWTALKVAAGAAGIRGLAKPLVQWAAGHAPAWIRPLFTLVLWALEKKPGATVTAEAAGDAAVAAKPAPGAEAVTGAHREVR